MKLIKHLNRTLGRIKGKGVGELFLEEVAADHPGFIYWCNHLVGLWFLQSSRGSRITISDRRLKTALGQQAVWRFAAQEV
jgi:hypothetical protein